MTSFAYKEFEPAAAFAVKLVAKLEQQPLALPVLLNVNVPPVPAADIKGAAIARQGMRRYFDQFEQRTDPRGRTYYWLAGEVIEEGDAELSMPIGIGTSVDRTQALVDEISAVSDEFMTDVEAIKQNYITVTPLQYNLTAYTALSFVQSQLALDF